MRIKGLPVIRSGAPVARAQQVDTEPDGDEPVDSNLMVVRFSPFGEWYEINSYWEGQFLERTQAGAFQRTIGHAKRADGNYSTKSLFNHGGDFNIGDKLLGTVTSLEEKAGSPEMLVDLYRDVSYVDDLKPGLRAGDYGSSFMFEVLSDSWDHEPEASDHNPDRLPERTIQEVRLYEAGPVTWPANPAATAGLRSGCNTDPWIERMTERDSSRARDMMDMFKAFRAGNQLDAPAPAPEVETPARHAERIKAERAAYRRATVSRTGG